jgi:hypothetical protein
MACFPQFDVGIVVVEAFEQAVWRFVKPPARTMLSASGKRIS